MTNTTYYRACNLCEAICGLSFEMNGKGITMIRGDKDDPFSRGHICPKGPEIKNLYEDPDRLKQPLKKTADGWVSVKWEDAFADIAKRIVEIQKTYGNDSVAMYAGNPSVHNYGSMLFGERLGSTLKTKNKFSATSVDQLPHQLLAYLMFGHQLLIPIPDIDHTNFFLILGGNPFASNGSLMTVPDVKKRLKDLQARGGKYIVVDPRKTETAEHADEHIFIRPNTDAFFLLSVIDTLFKKNLVKESSLFETEQLNTLKGLASEYSSERVASITGVSKETIEKIAIEFGNAKGAVCYGRVGVSTQSFGSICQWLINCINLITGNLDSRGGAMFTLPAVDLVDPKGAMGASVGSFNTFQSRVRKLPEFNGELPVAALSEEILTPGEGQIKALITSAGNPVLSTPNGSKLDEALSKLDFMVCIDIYLNETTKHADYILPPTSALEHDHYDLIFNVFAVRNTAKYSEPLYEPGENMLHDWEIFSDLSKRIDMIRVGKEPPVGIIKGRLTPASIIDFALKGGPYGRKGKTNLNMSLDLLKQNPHGIDLGPLEPGFPDRLCTTDKKVKLIPETIVKDLERLRKAAKEHESLAKDSSRFLLIGRRHLRNNNSWMHNVPKLMAGKNRCTVLIHSSDAKKLGVKEQEEVIVKSSISAISLPVEISDEMMHGVVSIPHGFGHSRSGSKLSVASQYAGASINDLTDDQLLDEFSGNAAFSAVSVSIERKSV